MKKKYVLFVIVGLLIIVAAITNPSKDDFISWSKEKLKSESNNGLVNWGIEQFGDDIIGSVTKTKDFVLFSTFNLGLSNTENMKVLGVLTTLFHFLNLLLILLRKKHKAQCQKRRFPTH